MINSIRLPKTQTGYKSFYRILNASKVLFGEKGFLGTSTNEIIFEAKVSIGTFYIYFDDKRSVYDYLFNDYTKQIRKTIQMSIIDLTTFEEKIRAILKSFINLSIKDPLSYRIIWESMFVERQLFINYYTSLASIYIKQLTPAVSGDEVNPNIDLETLTYTLMGISNFIGLQVALSDSITDEKIDYIVDNVMKILKNGIFIT